MATSLAVSIALNLKTNYTTDDGHLDTPLAVISKAITDNLSNGQGSAKAESVYSISLTATDGAGTTIDVFGGIADVYGNTLSMDQIKGLLIHNTSTATGEYIDVFGSAQHLEYMTGATDEIRIFPDGLLFMWSPGAAADCPSPGAGAADEILIVAAAGKSPQIEIIIIGENN
jgi:hypothetical protein